MKHLCLVLLFLICAQVSKAQEASVEKSIYGIQTGFWGVWGYNESKLSSKWALRTEVGFFDYYGVLEGLRFEPVLTVEPRWYFGLPRRLSKGRQIDNNSAAFIAFRTSFRPDIFDIPALPEDDLVNPSVAVVPYFGIRKPVGEKFNYELGLGFGVEYFFKGWDGFVEDSFTEQTNEKFMLAFNIHLRFGLNL